MQLDLFSFHCGILDSLSEQVGAGVKRLGIGHSIDDLNLLEDYVAFCREVSIQYGIHFFLERAMLETDLFAADVSHGKIMPFLYRDDEYLQWYLELKHRKAELLMRGAYNEDERRRLAFDFGRLLSYPTDAILYLINSNADLQQPKPV